MIWINIFLCNYILNANIGMMIFHRRPFSLSVLIIMASTGHQWKQDKQVIQLSPLNAWLSCIWILFIDIPEHKYRNQYNYPLQPCPSHFKTIRKWGWILFWHHVCVISHYFPLRNLFYYKTDLFFLHM